MVDLWEYVCTSCEHWTHLQVRQAELDLPVQTSGSHQGRVQGVRSVGGHQHFDVASRVEAIQLVDELQHSPLDLVVSTSTVIKTSAWQVQKRRTRSCGRLYSASVFIIQYFYNSVSFLLLPLGEGMLHQNWLKLFVGNFKMGFFFFFT